MVEINYGLRIPTTTPKVPLANKPNNKIINRFSEPYKVWATTFKSRLKKKKTYRKLRAF